MFYIYYIGKSYRTHCRRHFQETPSGEGEAGGVLCQRISKLTMKGCTCIIYLSIFYDIEVNSGHTEWMTLVYWGWGDQFFSRQGAYGL